MPKGGLLLLQEAAHPWGRGLLCSLPPTRPPARKERASTSQHQHGPLMIQEGPLESLG